MADSSHPDEQSSQSISFGAESPPLTPQNLQSLNPTIAPTPGAPSGQSIPSRSVTPLAELSAEILQAIESQQWENLMRLVRREEIISERWWVQDKDYPTNYRSSKYLSGFRIIFDEEYEDKIAKAVSMSSKGNLPVHIMTRFITITHREFGFEQIKRSISILSGFGGTEFEHWRQKNAEGKNALHIAAAGQGERTEDVLRALLELMAVSTSHGSIAGLDDQTKDEHGDDNTALHLAALDILRTRAHSSWFQGASEHPFNRLLLAGANPWIQNRAKDTVLHLLVKARPGQNNDREFWSGRAQRQRDSTKIEDTRDNARIQGVRDVLRQKGVWKSQLVATNGAGKTAMSLALSTKDYKMVLALAEAPQTASFVLEEQEMDIWRKDEAVVFDVAVLTQDTDLDSIRGRLIRTLALDESVKKRFNERDIFGLTPLHKVCNLGEDRDDIAKALVENGANVRKRVGQPAKKHGKEAQRYTGWPALYFAVERGHCWTVSLLLAEGAIGNLTSAERSYTRQRAYEKGNYMIGDLIQHFRTHGPEGSRGVLERPHESEGETGLEFLATKWPSKGIRSQEEDDDEDRISRNSYEAFGFETVDYRSYPERRPVRHMIYCHDDASWDTWTRKNGGWIHLPANNWKWIKGICRSSYINEERFPQWLESHFDKSPTSRAAPAKFLNNTYMPQKELLRIFPELERSFDQHSGTWTSREQRSPSPHTERRRRQLAVECREVLAFMQDSLSGVQQHGTEHSRVRNGFRSLVVQRQDPGYFGQFSQPSSSSDEPGGPPKPGSTYLGRDYTLKSVVLPILDVDWMLSYLKVTGHNSFVDKSLEGNQTSTQQPPTSLTNGLIGNKVYRTRLAESEAIVELDLELKPDRRKEKHWDQMKRLFETFKDAQEPFSLDQYFHQDLTKREVQERVSSQVVSRFIYYQHCPRTPALDKKSGIASKFAQGEKWALTTLVRDFISNPRQLFKREQDRDLESAQRTPEAAFSTASESNIESDPLRGPRVDPEADSPRNSEGDPEGDPGSDFESDPVMETPKSVIGMVEPPWQKILIVPQLWLFTVDNTVFTSFPDRWDRFNAESSLPRSLETQVKALPMSIDADELLHNIFECAMKYFPSFSASGERFTYSEAFSGEIRRLSRMIEASYDDFHRNLGNSDDVFLDAFQTPTYCLRTIDDVLRELDMIKRVYQDQTHVWEDFHNASSTHKDTRAGSGISRPPDNRKCPYSTTCDPKVLPERLFTTVSNLVDEARIVQESAVTLLTLLQGEASTENTISTSRQSKILGVFTVVTVVFAPLSWIAAIFALQIQNTTWTWPNVIRGSVASASITFLLCALGWLCLDWRNIKRVLDQARNWLNKLYA